MRLSSLLRLGAVVTLFVLIQGWLLMHTFVSPRVFEAAEASLRGATVDIRSPASGTLQTVAVHEGQRVEEGELLFVVQRTVVDPDTMLWSSDELPVYAQQSGVVSGVFTMRGTFVNGEQKLAMIVDNSPDSLYVLAKLNVPPGDVTRIRRLMSATVQGDFLNDGKPIDAIISTVDPLYDKDGRTLTVRLQLLRYPQEVEAGLPLDVPVSAEIRQDRDPDENAVIALINWIFPSSQAQPDE